jgi:hypothetical protein
MAPAPQDELAALEWALGAIVTVLLAVFSHIYLRISRVEDNMDRNVNSLWTENRAADQRFQQHRGEVLRDMVTKSDLAGLERRIMEAIRDRQAIVPRARSADARPSIDRD